MQQKFQLLCQNAKKSKKNFARGYLTLKSDAPGEKILKLKSQHYYSKMTRSAMIATIAAMKIAIFALLYGRLPEMSPV